ncbi:hypothetical protein ACJMK2_020037 [Sinanodonta woodiana]|uniref:C-type lectin domain-containing protein n=1 Tax=Sinanodonta woodiana TaxID=1069815 RepID=A0ABD3TZ54_SINWO
MRGLSFTRLCRFLKIPFPTHGQCGDGWLFRENSCYHISHDREEWASAEFMCHTMGGYLVEINNADEGHFLEHQVKLFNFSEGQTWIGATDILVEGDWVWADSQTSLSSRAYTNWLAGEPNNLGRNENCLSLFNSGLWNDEDCDTHFHYICEKQPIHELVTL